MRGERLIESKATCYGWPGGGLIFEVDCAYSKISLLPNLGHVYWDNITSKQFLCNFLTMKIFTNDIICYIWHLKCTFMGLLNSNCYIGAARSISNASCGTISPICSP